MGYGSFSRDTYHRAEAEIKAAGGSATGLGEQREREGKGLHELVDPKGLAGFGVVRPTHNRCNQLPSGLWELSLGVAVSLESLFDTTGSMGGNVQLAFDSLPALFDMLANGANPVLAGRDVHLCTAIFGDVQDKYVLRRTQFEMQGERIIEQMRLMFPERGGFDDDEDPQYGLFGAAYCTRAQLNDYGLKGYHFTVSDARGRSRLNKETIIRVFGSKVFDEVAENGYQINPAKLPDTQQVVADLQRRSHAFFIQVGDRPHVTDFWRDLYGADRMIRVESTQYLAHVEAAVVGLTEGTLDLQNAEEFLRSAGQLPATTARRLVRSFVHIPLRAQADLPGYSKLPKRGDLFANKGDLWPVAAGDVAMAVAKAPPSTLGSKDDGGTWAL